MDSVDQTQPIGNNPDTVVDRSVLAAMSRGDASIEREFITLYRRLNDEDMVKLHAAVAAGQIAAAVQASHRISGASRMIGAIALAAASSRVEHASRAGSLQDVKAELPALEREIARVHTFLDLLLLDHP